MYLSTGDAQGPYQVLDCIFAFDTCKEGLLRGSAPGKAFEGVKNQLQNKAKQLGADAVINCHFEYHSGLSEGLNPKKIVEVFAYGTAVILGEKK